MVCLRQLFVAHALLDHFNGCFKRRNMLSYDHPNDVIRYFMVFVTQDVPNTANLFPW